VDQVFLQVPDSEDNEQVIVGPPGLGNGGKQVHPLPYLDSSIPGTLPQTANFRSWVLPLIVSRNFAGLIFAMSDFNCM
jgi:hypothetical protein